MEVGDQNIFQEDLFSLIDKAAKSGRVADMVECYNCIKTTSTNCSQEILDSGLLSACCYGRKFLVHVLLSYGANMETRDDDGNTPLLICAEKGFTEIALSLVEKGAEINSYNKDGDTALLLAIESSGCSELVVELGDKTGINIYHKNNQGYTALMKAFDVFDLPTAVHLLTNNEELFESVSKSKTDLLENLCSSLNYTADADDNVSVHSIASLVIDHVLDGGTFLEKAVLNKDIQIIQLLLDSGMSGFYCSTLDEKIISKFLTSLLYSSKEINERDLNIIKVLIKAGAPLNSTFRVVEDSPLFLAIKIGKFELVEMLCCHGADVNKCDHTGQNPLVVAAKSGRCDMMNLLIKHGANVNSTETCLALLVSFEGSKLDCAKLLVKHRAKMDMVKAVNVVLRTGDPERFLFLMEHFKSDFSFWIDSAGNELINKAAELGHKDLIKLLLEQGVDVNASYNDKTPLVSATDPEVLEFLINLGANVNKQIKSYFDTCTALICILRKELFVPRQHALGRVQTLLRHGANVQSCDTNGDFPLLLAVKNYDSLEITEALLQAGANVNQLNNDGVSALHVAAQSRSLSKVKLLLAQGSDVNIKTTTEQTPLQYAFSSPDPQIIQHLVEQGASVNVVDYRGNTPLLLASSLENDAVIKSIVKAGADMNHQNNRGYTALMLAAKKCKPMAIKALCESGADVNCISTARVGTALSLLLGRIYVGKLNYEECINCLIENGADCSFLQPTVVQRLIYSRRISSLKYLISLGFGPVNTSEYGNTINSPFKEALSSGCVGTAKFFNKISFLTRCDVTALSLNKVFRNCLESNGYSECLKFFDEYSSQPMSLQKLSFVVVSSAVGADAGRKERVRKLPIPKLIHDMLLFKHAQDVDDEELLVEQTNIYD
ncbi:putative ankyrin repeat protein RF_0381 [Physella acuta]|uniref:putative ankyrin repeat protein RF_0381 n=1 Tax=Physella acuta TaxID=109671 RepID=UPI0027DC3065|nr:putative ankyrin repeat protein RF_0381 [Physella acuta]